MTDIIAWVTGTWFAGSVHAILGVVAQIVLVGIPTVFKTNGDKKHSMVETPGPIRAGIDFFQFGVAAVVPWFMLPNGLALVCVAIVIAALIFGRRRFLWLFRGAPV